LTELAKTDPDASVRGACWEAFGELDDEPELMDAMLRVLANPQATIEEKGGAAIGLAEQSDNPEVYEAILSLYQDPRGRAKALKAMARSFDKRFADVSSHALGRPGFSHQDAGHLGRRVPGSGFGNAAAERAFRRRGISHRCAFRLCAGGSRRNIAGDACAR
jgi:hypothetical protein